MLLFIRVIVNVKIRRLNCDKTFESKVNFYPETMRNDQNSQIDTVTGLTI